MYGCAEEEDEDKMNDYNTSQVSNKLGAFPDHSKDGIYEGFDDCRKRLEIEMSKGNGTAHFEWSMAK